MDICVDGWIYQYQRHMGISRIFDAVLPLICDLDDSVAVTLLVPSHSKRLPPRHAHIRYIYFFSLDRLFRPRQLWGSLALRARTYSLKTALQGENKGIWHSTYYTNPESWNGPVVVTVHDMIHEIFPNLFPGTPNDRFILQKRDCVLNADKIICVSSATQRDLQQYWRIPSDRTCVIPLAHDPVFRAIDDTNELLGVRKNRPFLLYVGRRTLYKNFIMLLNVYSRWSLRKEVDLVVIGDQWSKHELEMLATLKIEGQVNLMQAVDDQLLCTLYNQSLAFVYPSLYEGFGIPLLEAMACGCPVVASEIPSSMEVAGDVPVYFEVQANDSLEAALDRVVTEGRNSARTERGLERARTYSWEKTAVRTLEVYREIFR